MSPSFLSSRPRGKENSLDLFFFSTLNNLFLCSCFLKRFLKVATSFVWVEYFLFENALLKLSQSIFRFPIDALIALDKRIGGTLISW